MAAPQRDVPLFYKPVKKFSSVAAPRPKGSDGGVPFALQAGQGEAIDLKTFLFIYLFIYFNDIAPIESDGHRGCSYLHIGLPFLDTKAGLMEG